MKYKLYNKLTYATLNYHQYNKRHHKGCEVSERPTRYEVYTGYEVYETFNGCKAHKTKSHI